MTYLRFDTDHGRDTVARLHQVIENVRAESESTYSNVNSLVGNTWTAPAAYEFQKQMSEWHWSLNNLLGLLTDLNHRLNMEIDSWEEMAAIFGGVSLGDIKILPLPYPLRPNLPGLYPLQPWRPQWRGKISFPLTDLILLEAYSR